MAQGRTKRWTKTQVKSGIVTVNLSSWKYFSDYIKQELAEFRTYIFRGQKNDKLALEPSLFRILNQKPPKQFARKRYNHLRNFQSAVRGRRGPNPPQINDENEWWALGQHHGLVTPLLDWTESPFAALFFAFEKADDGNPNVARVVYCLAESAIEGKRIEIQIQHEKEKTAYEKKYGQTGLFASLSNRLQADQSKEPKPPAPEEPQLVEIVRPLTDENARLVSQRGLFVRIPDSISLEQWISKNFANENNKYILIKIHIRNTGRTDCLRFLNRMNINHLSLFPDLYGASKYCNIDLYIDNY